MRTKSLILALALALLALPSWALADGGRPTDPGKSASHASPRATKPTPPDAPAGEKAKAYGKLCQGESKKHVAGQKGTPFSQCVTAMAKLASGETSSPTKACKGLSKKHVAGQKGTPFSVCVAAAAKLRKE
jgi:hypothetical protein